RVHLCGIAAPHHDGETVVGVGDRRVEDVRRLLHLRDARRAGGVYIGLEVDLQIAQYERTLLHLAREYSGRKRLDEDALVLRMLRTKCVDEIGNYHELVAREEQYEIGVCYITVEVGHVVDVGYDKCPAALRSSTPRRILFCGARCCGRNDRNGRAANEYPRAREQRQMHRAATPSAFLHTIDVRRCCSDMPVIRH